MILSETSSDFLHALVQVRHIVFPKETFVPGNWAVFVCDVFDVFSGEPYDPQVIKLKGTIYSLDVGGLYNFKGRREEHPTYGSSYQIISFNKEFNLQNASYRRLFLESLYTPNQVNSLYDAFPDPFQIIQDGNVKKLCEAKNIGPFIANKMVGKFREDYKKSRAYVELGQYNLSPSLIDSLIRRFHGDIDKLIYTVNKNPYIMMHEVDGIGWAKADQIAKAKGVQPNDPLRIEAGTLYLLHSVTENGNTWVTPQWLASEILRLLGLSADSLDAFRNALYTLHEEEKVWWSEDKNKIALARVRKMEEDIATELRRLSSAAPLIPRSNLSIDESLAEIESEQGWEFTEEQRNAIRLTLDNNVSIITGGAGVGKSSSVGGVLRVLGNYSFAQCALSGRAAARLSEVTHNEGMTIHRLLGASPAGVRYTEENHLSYDIIILDEVSMVGAEIFLLLLKAIPTGSKLIMLGDDGQLESIGLCNVFKDMLDSGVVPVSRLTKIHRQAAKSAIITESIKVRNQQDLIPDGWVGHEVRGELQDLELNIYGDAILSQDTILETYQRLLESGVSYHDIQVIVPTKQRGMICTHVLNTLIQDIVNPATPENQGVTIGNSKNKKASSYTLRRNDRVIVTKNMYQASRYSDISDWDSETDQPDTIAVYNGDRGIIKFATPQQLVVTFDQWGDVSFKRDCFHNIELGYALSCHKLQGSEANYVIVGFDMSGMILLSKEWLYTAITRAKKHCVICAETRSVSYANHRSNISQKQTMLKELLRIAFDSNSNESREVVFRREGEKTKLSFS